MRLVARSLLSALVSWVVAVSAGAGGGGPAPVVHPQLWNAETNDPAVDQPPGLGTSYTSSPTQGGADTIEDAFGNQDGGVEPATFIFGDAGTPDDGNQVLGDGGETVDFIEWQTTVPVEVFGYRLLISQLDPFGRQIELVRFLVDAVELDFFDNDSAQGVDNSTVNEVLRPFAGGPVTGSTFRIELTRASNGPRITEIDALTESFCGNGTVEGPEECDDANTVDGDGCDSLCIAETTCPPAPAGGCLVAAKASLTIIEKKPGSEKLKASLKGFDGATAQADFGDPVTGATRYDVCIYDAAGALAAELVVDRATDACGAKAKPCWKPKGDKGWSYKDPDTASDGVKKIAAAGGPPGKGKLQVQAGNKAKKGQTAMPVGTTAQLAGETSATLQLRTSDGVCVEAALATVKKADPVQFKARN